MYEVKIFENLFCDWCFKIKQKTRVEIALNTSHVLISIC